MRPHASDGVVGVECRQQLVPEGNIPFVPARDRASLAVAHSEAAGTPEISEAPKGASERATFHYPYSRCFIVTIRGTARAIDPGDAGSDPTHSQTHTVDWCNDGR